YEVHTEDFYADMLHPKLQDLFDTSDYPTSHPNFSNKNKKVLGKMKDELNGVPIEEFVALRSKMYSIKSAEPKHDKKVAKGIARTFVKKHLTHADFVQCLES